MTQYSLLVWDRESIMQGIGIASQLPDKISRIKLGSNPIREGDISTRDIEEALEMVGGKTSLYLGGWLTDIAQEVWQLRKFTSQLQKFGISTIEVWNPSASLIKTLQSEFKTVLVEIWTKSHTDAFSYDYRAWETSLRRAIDSGIQNIIIEWGIWKVGIYTPQREIRVLLLMYLIKRAQELWYTGDIVLEAAYPEHQDYMFRIFWQDIHLWNLSPMSFLYHPQSSENVLNISQKAPLYTPERISAFYEILDFVFETARIKGIDPSRFLFDMRLTSIDGNQVLDAIWEVKELISEMIPWEDSLFFDIEWDMPLWAILEMLLRWAMRW